MSQESVEAYADVKASGKEATQVRRILQHLATAGAATSHEIAKASGLTAYSVSKRRGYLLRTGLVREQLPRRCRVTGYNAQPIQATDEGREVADGADAPKAAPGRRELELLALQSAREFAEIWRLVPDAPLPIKTLVDRVWALDHYEDRHRAGVTAIREPWGSPRRGPLSGEGVWLRRNGDEVRISEMNDHHLRSSIEWCQENLADPLGRPLMWLLWEQNLRTQERKT